MIKTLQIFYNSLRRSKYLLIISLICGLLLCGLNVLINNIVDKNLAGISIGIHDSDNSRSSKEFTSYLKDELGMDIQFEKNTDILNTRLVEKHISAIVYIPEGFEQSIIDEKLKPLEIAYTGDYENAAFVDGYLDSYVKSLRITALPSGGDINEYYNLVDDSKNNKSEVITKAVDENIKTMQSEKNGLDITLGFFLMVSFILALGFSSMIVTDRKEGTFNRIKVTSVNTAQYVIGMCLSSIVCSMLIIVPFFIYISVANMTIHIPTIQLILLCLLYSLIVVAISLFIAMLLNSKNSIMAALVGFTTVTCILGGAFFPLDYSPEFMQQLALITPQYWFMDSMRVLLDDPNGDWWINGVILSMFAILFFVLTGTRFADTKPQVQ